MGGVAIGVAALANGEAATRVAVGNSGEGGVGGDAAGTDGGGGCIAAGSALGNDSIATFAELPVPWTLN